jgi:hypothetical protein
LHRRQWLAAVAAVTVAAVVVTGLAAALVAVWEEVSTAVAWVAASEARPPGADFAVRRPASAASTEATTSPVAVADDLPVAVIATDTVEA